MFAGKDFPSFFEEDLFTVRRSGAFAAGNPFDPESLLTGAEMAAGFDYGNSRRNWPDEETYRAAVAGQLNTEDILRVAPRASFGPSLRNVTEVLSYLESKVLGAAPYLAL